jgi:hypothetical protein
MKQARHIFTKDLRYLWREVLLVGGLAAMYAVEEAKHPSPNSLFGVLLIAAVCWLVVRVIQAEVLAGDDQFWVTRPYAWKSLLGSKLLFIAVFAELPIFLSQAAILIAAGFPARETVSGFLWEQVLFWFCLALPLASLTAVASGIVPLMLTVFALLVAFVAFPLLVPMVVFEMGTVLGPLEWVKDAVAGAAAAAIAMLVLYLQYRRCETFFSRAFMLTAGSLAAIAYLYLPWSFAFALQSRLSQKGFDAASLQIGLAKPGLPPSQFLPDFFRVQVPLAIEGLPQFDEVHIDLVRMKLQWPDGRVWESKAREMVALERRLSAGTVFDGVILVDKPTLTGEGKATVTLRASVYLTLFGNARSRVFDPGKRPVDVIDGLRCSLFPFPPQRVLCAVPFRWPSEVIAANFSAADYRAFGQVSSYSPFPAGLGLYPIDSRVPFGTPPVGHEVGIRIQEPIAHIRRDVQLSGVHIEDFAIQ